MIKKSIEVTVTVTVTVKRNDVNARPEPLFEYPSPSYINQKMFSYCASVFSLLYVTNGMGNISS